MKEKDSMSKNTSISNEGKLQPLQQNGQRKARVFIKGCLKGVDEFVGYVKTLNKIYKSSQTGLINQRFKYQMSGLMIYKLLQWSKNFFNRNKDLADHNMPDDEEEEVKLYTHHNPQYNLAKFKSSLSSPSSNSSSCCSEEKQSTKLSNSVIDTQLHNSNKKIQQLVGLLQEAHWNPAETELIRSILLTMKGNQDNSLTSNNNQQRLLNDSLLVSHSSQKYNKEQQQQQQQNEGVNSNQFVVDQVSSSSSSPVTVTIMKRIFELIGKQSVVGYREIVVILEKEGYKYYDITSTLANNKPQIDNLIEIFSDSSSSSRPYSNQNRGYQPDGCERMVIEERYNSNCCCLPTQSHQM